MSTSRKMGESQVIDFFSTALRDKFVKKFGSEANYSIGNFSGSQDRKFADFFAGINSSSILIEFKERESEVTAEHGKPLRKKLCIELTADTARLSRDCHFIAWGKCNPDLEVTITPYVDLVCRKFIGEPPLQAAFQTAHSEFIKDFLNGSTGMGQNDFIKYVGHLNSVAGGTREGSEAPFRSMLYSRNSGGDVVGTRFENLGQLKNLLSMKPKRSWHP